MFLFRSFLVLALAAAALPSLAEEIPLALDAAVHSAIEKNLDLRVEDFNPAIADTNIRGAKGIYNPRLAILLDYRGEDAPLDTSGNLVDQRRFWDADVSTDFLLPTGAAVSAAFTNVWSRNLTGAERTLVLTPSRFVEPQLSLSFSQPLLKGFGKEVTEKDITIARFGKESSLHQWRNTAMTTVSNVRDQYIALVKARESLQTRRAALAVLQEVHSGNRARVDAGVLAAVELLDSEFGVAQREVELLTAEKNVRDASDRLRSTIQYPSGDELVPTDPLTAERIESSEEQAMETAFRSRPDLLVARVNLKTEEFNSRIAKNAALPSIAVTGSVGVEALRSSYGDALSDLGSAESPFWSVGLSFEYPIGNDAAKASLAASRLRARQSDARIRSLEESIRLDVRAAIRALDTGFLQVAAAQKGVELGEARLDSFVKRQRVGLAVTKDILQAEADLTAARETLAAARADYQGAITRFWRSTGELLERQGIPIDDRAIDTLARKDAR